MEVKKFLFWVMIIITVMFLSIWVTNPDSSIEKQKTEESVKTVTIIKTIYDSNGLVEVYTNNTMYLLDDTTQLKLINYNKSNVIKVLGRRKANYSFIYILK